MFFLCLGAGDEETGQIADREGGARGRLEEERMDRKVGRSEMGTRMESIVGVSELSLERMTRDRRFEWKEELIEEMRVWVSGRKGEGEWD